MQNSCLKTSAWWSLSSHFVENGYPSLRFPNMVKMNIHKHWTLVTRFNPLWVSGLREIKPAKPTNQSVRTINWSWVNTMKLMYLIVVQRDILWIFINVMHPDHKRACHWVRRKTAVCAFQGHCVFCILLVIQSRLLKSDFSRRRFNSKKVKKTRSTTVDKKKKDKWWIFIIYRLQKETAKKFVTYKSSQCHVTFKIRLQHS